MKALLIINSVLGFLLLMTGCNQQPNIDMSEVLGQTQETLRELEEIETTAASNTKDKEVKLRLMVEGYPTEEEAIILFNKILDSIVQASNHSNVWDFYNGYFDIKSYEYGVIYEATKLIDEDLDISSK